MDALEEIAASVTRYYGSLTDEQITEGRAWGQFAETQFPDDDCYESLSERC